MRNIMIMGVVAGMLLALSNSGRVYAADSVKLTGEIVDTYCYALMGAKGEGHRTCGIACAEKGIPMALLENATNKLYVLLPNKDKTALPKTVMEKMGRQATITGKVYSNGGSQFLTVESIQ